MPAARHGFFNIANDTERIYAYQSEGAGNATLSGTPLENYTYGTIMTHTIYAGAPRGDCKYSYKFTEALAGGAIPVVLADDWVFPFRPELINWSECVVIIPERDSNERMNDVHEGNVVMIFIHNMLKQVIKLLMGLLKD